MSSKTVSVCRVGFGLRNAIEASPHPPPPPYNPISMCIWCACVWYDVVLAEIRCRAKHIAFSVSEYPSPMHPAAHTGVFDINLRLFASIIPDAVALGILPNAGFRSKNSPTRPFSHVGRHFERCSTSPRLFCPPWSFESSTVANLD